MSETLTETVEDSIFELRPEEIDRYPIGVITVDRAGIIRQYNRAEAAFSRLDPMDVLGRAYFGDVAPCAAVREFQGRFEKFAEMRDTGAERFDFAFRFAWGTQDVRITLLRRANLEEIHIVVRVRSVNRTATPAVVRAATAVLQGDRESVAHTCDIGHFMEDASGQVVWSDGLRAILGLPAHAAASRDAYEACIHPDDVPSTLAAIHAARRSPKDSVWRHRVVRPDGTTRSVQTQLTRFGDLTGWLGTVVDLTERESSDGLSRRAAHFDPLTQLPNRQLFLRRTAEAMLGGPATVLFVDLDRFKLINDAAGHTVGDQVLRMTASRLVQCVGGNATVARLNGDEFAVVLPDAREAAVHGAADAIIDAIGYPFVVDDHLYYVSASVGSARSPDDTDDAEALLHAADIAMSHAKRRARGSYVHYSREIHAADTVARTHEAELRDAIASGQFRLHYQPIFDAASGRLAAVEALLRWQHPEHGLVAPGAFIPLAEKTGLIEPIGRWVLRAACTQMVAWRHAGVDVPRVTVNVSTAQFTSSRFAQSVQALLETAGLPPDALEIEITENVLIERIDETLGVISDLKVIGVRVSIDDFGTGYSALSYLKFLPVDVLKLDRSFVTGLGNGGVDEPIAEAIVNLAQSLKLDVVAEGVENQAQLDVLRRLHCSHVQGFLLGRPVDADALSAAFGAA